MFSLYLFKFGSECYTFIYLILALFSDISLYRYFYLFCVPNVYFNKSSVMLLLFISNFNGKNLSVPVPSQLIIIPPIKTSWLLSPIHSKLIISLIYLSKMVNILLTSSNYSFSAYLIDLTWGTSKCLMHSIWWSKYSDFTSPY